MASPAHTPGYAGPQQAPYQAYQPGAAHLPQTSPGTMTHAPPYQNQAPPTTHVYQQAPHPPQQHSINEKAAPVQHQYEHQHTQQQQIHHDHAQQVQHDHQHPHAGPPHHHGAPPAKRGNGGPPGKWNESYCGFCSPFDLCCVTFWLPCLTFGKTHHRLRSGGNMENYSNCNGSCWLFCGASCFGLHWIPMMIQRMDLREKYGIDGNGCGDCCSAYCCPLCDLAQADKEAKGREGHGKGPVIQQYQAQGGMHM